ncbi:MAG: chemotaxis protein CheB, partial [Myxococcota bacterium]
MSAKNPQQVIGVGASAGGLDALKELFGQLKPDTTHASWVVVQHLSPDYKSIMVELLRRTTQLQVVEAEDQLQLAVDTIYVAQPGTEVNVDGLILKVEAISQQQRPIPHHPIDTMLLSLASRSDVPVVAIILSGTGSDGAKGCAAVRSSGGTVMAQDNRSAQFDGMPRSAVLTGCVDFVLPPRLMRDIVSQLPQQRGHTQPIETPRQMVLGRLHQTSGLDTRHYKDNGLDRRLEQRMSAVGVLSMGDYEGFTRLNPDEVGALRRAILIGVTEFFRDPEAWEHLEHNILPNLLMERDPSQTIRVWSAGCSTGEEAYSMALVFHRALGRLGITRDIKIFATDANPEAIRTASTGIYPLDGLKNIRPDAMESAFLPISDTRVQIIPAVRQYVVFAQHDILNDPPFMSLDLIICRNLLIYLKNEAQEHALSRLMYGLKPGGVLFLGPSESLGKLDPCCRTLNSRWNIYTLLHRPTVELGPFIHPTSRRYEKPHPPLVGSRMLTKLQEALDAYYHVLAVELCTVSLVVDSSQRLLYSVGPTEGLLNFRPGRISLQLMDVLDRSLIPTVQVAIRRAQSEESQVAISGSILADGRHITITAIPIEGEGEAVFLVALQWSSTQASRPVQTLQASQGDDLLRLERELSIARESLQLTVEELEAS